MKMIDQLAREDNLGVDGTTLILNTDDDKEAQVEGFWAYKVDKRSQNWVFHFDTEPRYRVIRFHTSRSYAPYLQFTMTFDRRLIIKPGQWLEGLVNGRWNLLSGADHR